MQIMAVIFAVCLFASPVVAQDLWSPEQELADIFDRPSRQADPDPLEYWDRDQERAERQLRMQHMHEERARQKALGTCATIWNNAAARAECRRSFGGY